MFLVPESPANSASHRNLTGLPRTVRDIAADIYNNIQQWNTLHIKGSTIIKEIVNLKSNSKKNYPDGLEELSNVLYEVITSQNIILSNLKTCSEQLESVVILHKSIEPLFISWSAEKIAIVAGKIYQDYNQEFQVISPVSYFRIERVTIDNYSSTIMFFFYL